MNKLSIPHRIIIFVTLLLLITVFWYLSFKNITILFALIPGLVSTLFPNKKIREKNDTYILDTKNLKFYYLISTITSILIICILIAHYTIDYKIFVIILIWILAPIILSIKSKK